jgi:hypothetical protein
MYVDTWTWPALEQLIMYLTSCVETEVGKNEEIFDNSAFVVHSLMQIAPLYCSKRIFFVSTIDSSGVQAHTFHNDHISKLQPTSGFQNSADSIGSNFAI